MKRIIGIFYITITLLTLTATTFWQYQWGDWWGNTIASQCPKNQHFVQGIGCTLNEAPVIGTTCNPSCNNNQRCDCTEEVCECLPLNDTTTNQTSNIPNNPNVECNTVNGITICEDCLTNGQCKFNIYDTLGIRTSVRSTWQATSVGLFVQDIVLSATFFIWTVVTVALIVSGLMYIFAAASGKDPSNAKTWITGALIGLVIVACSYFIIRLVQYLAKGV